jgi:hypothetical protein
MPRSPPKNEFIDDEASADDDSDSGSDHLDKSLSDEDELGSANEEPDTDNDSIVDTEFEDNMNESQFHELLFKQQMEDDERKTHSFVPPADRIRIEPSQSYRDQRTYENEDDDEPTYTPVMGKGQRKLSSTSIESRSSTPIQTTSTVWKTGDVFHYGSIDQLFRITYFRPSSSEMKVIYVDGKKKNKINISGCRANEYSTCEKLNPQTKQSFDSPVYECFFIGRNKTIPPCAISLDKIKIIEENAQKQDKTRKQKLLSCNNMYSENPMNLMSPPSYFEWLLQKEEKNKPRASKRALESKFKSFQPILKDIVPSKALEDSLLQLIRVPLGMIRDSSTDVNVLMQQFQQYKDYGEELINDIETIGVKETWEKQSKEDQQMLLRIAFIAPSISVECRDALVNFIEDEYKPKLKRQRASNGKSTKQ